MIEVAKLNNGLTVLAKTDKKFGLSAKTFANRAQAHKAKEAVMKEGIDLICHVTYSRPFYVVIRDWREVFNECCESFKLGLQVIANKNNKPLSQVFLWWREYENSVSGEGGQSALLWEFERWYEARLKA